MTPWLVIGCAWLTSAVLLFWSRARARSSNQIEEALPECTIGELEPGRFRIRGRVVAIDSTRSLVDGVDCVYVERAEYQALGSNLLPLVREVAHRAFCHPFYLEDDSGRILVDPSASLIECATAIADGGLTAERRLRDGEEVTLAATFRASASTAEDGEGPYRASARQWAAVADVTGPPRLSHRTADMLRPPPDEVSAFLGGAGGILFAMGLLFALVIAFTS